MTEQAEGPAKCQSCRAAIVWARTASGKMAPFEVDAAGVWVIVNGAARHVGSVKQLAQGSLELEAGPPPQRHTSHFATCPDATAWRNRDA